MITISAFRWVPPPARGQVRDLRVRWALEEAGIPYSSRLLEQGDQDKDAYRALQPFGQVPIFEEDGQTLFESGAIVLHIGERSEMLLPNEPGARARATQWLIAALNSIEPHVQSVAVMEFFYAHEEWAKLRGPSARAFAGRRLDALAKALGDKPYLDGEQFTAGDLMMATVLRIKPDLVVDPRLTAYVERCTAAGVQAGAGRADGRLQRRRVSAGRRRRHAVAAWSWRFRPGGSPERARATGVMPAILSSEAVQNAIHSALRHRHSAADHPVAGVLHAPLLSRRGGQLQIPGRRSFQGSSVSSWPASR